MRGGIFLGALAGCCWVASSTGCVSLDDHMRMKAANRTLRAEKESLSQELFDERSVNDNLRTKVVSVERELSTQGELLSNLRGENDLLDEMRKTAQTALEDMQGRQTLGNLALPRLPVQLDSALKAFADAHPTEVTYDSSRGTVKWKSDLLFPLGSDQVKAASLGALHAFAEIIKSPAAADFEVIVAGHTDNRPIQRAVTRQKHPTNWHLSAHRAIAVSNVLQKDGYQGERIGVMGCGEFRPIADNSSEAGNSQNRRVEIYLVPRGTIIGTSIALAAPGGGTDSELAPSTP